MQSNYCYDVFINNISILKGLCKILNILAQLFKTNDVIS